MVTIKDIAKEAGVSVTTVSNVIHNKKSRVSPELVKKINEIIKENHYSPNLSARSLVSKNSHIIGILSFGTKTDVQSITEDPFVGMLIRAMEYEISMLGYYTMIYTVSSEEELIALKNNWNLAGVIVYGLFEGKLYDFFTQIGIPCVLIDSYIKGESFYNIGIDDYKGGYMATNYLIKNGHKDIAFVSPIVFETGVIHERYKGYVDALKDAGLELKNKNVFQLSAVDAGYALGQNLASRKDITAIFATADLLALGIISGLQSMGVEVPDDISVVGFDDLDSTSFYNPPLTTVRQDVRYKGAVAVRTLINAIEGKETEKNISLPLKIVERKSVKKISD